MINCHMSHVTSPKGQVRQIPSVTSYTILRTFEVRCYVLLALICAVLIVRRQLGDAIYW